MPLPLWVLRPDTHKARRPFYPVCRSWACLTTHRPLLSCPLPENPTANWRCWVEFLTLKSPMPLSRINSLYLKSSSHQYSPSIQSLLNIHTESQEIPKASLMSFALILSSVINCPTSLAFANYHYSLYTLIILSHKHKVKRLSFKIHSCPFTP